LNVKSKEKSERRMNSLVGAISFVAALGAHIQPALLAQADAASSARGSDTKLSIDGTRFAIDGKPTFLLGVSYYGALGASEDAIKRDLDDMQRHGFNWFRMWATWSAFSNDVSAVDKEGQAREPYFSKLKWLIAECQHRGMVVDVSLSRGNGISGPSRLGEVSAHQRACETLASGLKHLPNWYLDLSNERNIKDKRYTSDDDLGELREAVRRIDPARLVTASHAGDISRDDLRDYFETAKLDFIAPHRPREPDSPGQTGAETKKYFSMMKELGRVVPVHYQEPFRRGYGSWNPRAEDFALDLAQAKDGGAAGWCFHNGDERKQPDGRPRRSFDLRDKRLFEGLDEEEMRFLKMLAGPTK
jgi:hypothetical protein